MSNEPAKNPDNKRVFLEANLSNWEQLSDDQKNEIVRRIYDGAIKSFGQESRKGKTSED